MRTLEAEGVLAELGAGQWGLLTAMQAQRLGVSRPRLIRLTDAGVLVRLTHGVYALRGAMSAGPVELRAAWLALDPARLAADRLVDGAGGAVVSHASAAVLHGLGDLDADRHEFTAPVRKQTRRSELRLHRTRLVDDDVTLHEGLPVTTVARTIVDLVGDGHDGGHVAGVLADAVRARRVDPGRLAPRLAPFAARFGLPRHDGHALVAHLLDLGGASEYVDADRVVAAARTAGISIPAVLALNALSMQLESQLAPLKELTTQQDDQVLPLRDQLADHVRTMVDQLQPAAALQAQLREVAAPLHEELRDAVASLHQLALLCDQLVESMRAIVEQLRPAAALEAQLRDAVGAVYQQTLLRDQQRLALSTGVATAQRLADADPPAVLPSPPALPESEEPAS